MNSVDPRTPVLVGTGQLIQKPDNPVDALEPLAMMRVALEAAADDAGARSSVSYTHLTLPTKRIV